MVREIHPSQSRTVAGFFENAGYISIASRKNEEVNYRYAIDGLSADECVGLPGCAGHAFRQFDRP